MNTLSPQNLFCCHWLIKLLPPFVSTEEGRERGGGGNKTKNILYQVLGMFQGLDNSTASWGCLLCEVVGFFLLLFNKDYRTYS